MPSPQFNARRDRLITRFNGLIEQPNAPDTAWDNGIFERYVNPIITAAHTPLTWRYDFNPTTNPFLIERMAVNGALNPGAILLNGMVYLVVRVEGADRKSFFAVAESPSGSDRFRFWDEPIVMPETDIPDSNVYDMRLTAHEDGWIYGVFCTERKDTSAAPSDMSSAVAQAAVARTKDLRNWERLPDLRTPSAQQRNAVLHPEFVDGCYAFYTRPQDGFINAGSGGGIGWGLCERINPAVIEHEIIVDARAYHTIKEAKNGQGPAPIKTARGWLHLAHGVRDCAAGLRYVLYMFMTDLHEPWRVTHSPGGYFLAPEGHERIGDVSNVAFCNGWIARPNGDVCIYYASSDTRCHVATTTVEKLVDYVTNTPPDGGRSAAVVEQRIELARRNLAFDPSLRGM